MQPATIKYYVGVRNGHRITLLVPGRIDSSGRERIDLAQARLVEQVIRGGDYSTMPHIAEPTSFSGALNSHTESVRHEPRFALSN